MLLIQEITLQWSKAERGATYAAIRQAFPLAYPLTMPFAQNHAILFHHTAYFQNGTHIQHNLDLIDTQVKQLQTSHIDISDADIQRFIAQQQKWIRQHTYQYYDRVQDVHCQNVHISKNHNAYTMTFCEQCHGMPIYRGHNKDFQNIHSAFYGKDLCNEIAFTLQENQYGRILYQKRFTDVDTGGWYYCLFVYNFLYTNQKNIPKQILTSRKPDMIYKKLGDLF